MVNPTTWNRWVLLAAFAVAVSVTVAGPTPAQAGPEDQARELLDDGDKYMRRGDARADKGRAERAQKYYERALEKYQKAYELVPKSSLFFAIAEAESRLGRHMDAVAHYQKVIAEVDSDELKEQARQRLDGLKQHVGVLAIEVKPDGAEVRINAEVRGEAPISGPFFLPPGEHTLAVSAEGYKPYEESVSLEAGVQVDREITLEREAVIGKAALEQPDDDPDEQPAELRKKKKLLPRPSAGKVVVGSAATAGLLVGATATGLLALSKHSAYEQAENVEDRDAARSSGQTFALVTDVLIVATVAAGAYTVYQYLGVYRPRKAAYDREQERRNDPKFWMTGFVDQHGGGLALGGRF